MTTIENTSYRRWLRRLMRGFLLRVVLILGVFAALHLLGFRKYTCVLSGTSPFGAVKSLFGVVYIVFSGLAVVGVPVLLLATVLARVVEWIASIPTINQRDPSTSSG